MNILSTFIQECGNTEPTAGHFFITFVLLSIDMFFVYSSVSIYQTFTRFIAQSPAWLNGCFHTPAKGLLLYTCTCTCTCSVVRITTDRSALLNTYLSLPTITVLPLTQCTFWVKHTILWMYYTVSHLTTMLSHTNL